MKTLLPAFTLTILMATEMQAQTIKPGFDCAAAKSDVEKTICANPDIAQADHAMSVAYKALLSHAPDAAFSKALAQDQRDFIAIRQEAFDISPNRAMALEGLRDRTELRAEYLNWINTALPSGFKGNWANAWGMLIIEESADGAITLEANVVDQVAGTWLCGYEGELGLTSKTEATAVTLTETLHLRRKGNLLEVTNHFCDETGPAINGSMKGYYFQIGAQD